MASLTDHFELVTGTRMHTRYFQTGGLAEDIPTGFFTECRKFVDYFPRRIDEYEAILDRQPWWVFIRWCWRHSGVRSRLLVGPPSR